MTSIGDVFIEACVKIVLALLVWFIGKFIVNKLLRIMDNTKALQKQEETLRLFLRNAAKIVLYVVLVVSIIGILGIPMASIIAVLASAGLAVGMGLQGSLGNLAGGIMLMVFRPFKVGDFIEAAGCAGTVKEINMFYTKLNTGDNKAISIPNGALMNASVTNMSSEALGRAGVQAPAVRVVAEK